MRSIAIIGLGYVGLPLAEQFLKKDFIVHGIDINPERITQITNKETQNPDVDDLYLVKKIESEQLKLYKSSKGITGTEAVIICVPTPLTEKDEPDLTFVNQAMDSLVPYVTQDQLVCLESTTYPGTTEELLQPKLEKRGFTIGENCFLAYSPERINPGSDVPISSIPKVVGGTTQRCLEIAIELYSHVFTSVHPVSSTKAAEMTKILENTQRFINISFINDFAILCEKMNLNVHEIIDAAATKPYGFTKYYPGPGIGGHCIPIDPHYLAFKVKEFEHDPAFITISDKVNKYMVTYVAEKIKASLEDENDRALVVGVAYKPDIGDVRESSALAIMDRLDADDISFDYFDPFVKEVNLANERKASITENALKEGKYKLAIVLTAHTNTSYEELEKIAEHVITPESLFLSPSPKKEGDGK
ncbi:nucleotide sugar dehydrogenase [Saliterribacillus persicus]|uniref:UDP-N-acetyl-D-glucosamine dehydrogenase n=1 Tax=Saliterribacillus persicus TaxID=930114 RepID=A0A368X4K0_9BACI|nr:nucleotide sugar dehydrogenase [Saliterribacillus persicus]RCW62863.1 UDP-N-acetyl-D-glucosamine dehydrogenase [Saliterribacillus persicus]